MPVTSASVTTTSPMNEREARAVDQPRQDVAPERVGAEDEARLAAVSPDGRGEQRVAELLARAVRREEGREDRDQHHRDEDDEAEERAAVAGEVAPVLQERRHRRRPEGHDPAAAWREQAASQQRLIDWLTGRKEVHLRGPGTDLRLSIEGRIWENCDGTRNFPDGEVCTSPVEDATEGHIRFSYPVVTDGREIDDVHLRFEGGRVVDAAASQGEAYLIETLEADAGVRRLGELAFGTNFDITRFSKTILFDEKIGGTAHLAIGAGFPELGGTNDSAIHWDLICDLRDGGSVDVDGEPFLRDGRYVVSGARKSPVTK